MANINSLSLLCEYKKTREDDGGEKKCNKLRKTLSGERCESSECFSQTENAVCAPLFRYLCVIHENLNEWKIRERERGKKKTL